MRFLTACVGSVLIGSLAACGGGGDDEAGSVTTFTTVPTSTTFTAPTGTDVGVCLPGGTTQVFVYGGAAPYRIDNTVPDYVFVDRTTVDSRGGSFNIYVLGGCLTAGAIVVVDKMDNIVTFTVDNKPASSS